MSIQRFASALRTCLAAGAVLFLVAASGYAADYHIIRRIPVGGEGGWDYLRVDPDAHRIYISRGSHTMIVDETSGKVIGDIPDTKGVHGIALAPELNKGFTSNGQGNSVTVFDLKTLKPVTEIKIMGQNPDWIMYDPVTKRVFTFNGRSNDATAIDATTDKVVGTVMLTGKPEEAVIDRGTIFVNIEDKGAITAFDAKTLAVKGTWPLKGCDSPSGLSIDSAHRRLFAACDKAMGVMNADNGQVVATIPIGGDPDGGAFDPATGLVFASCRDGFLSVIHEDSPDKYSVQANVPTQQGARTLTLDPKTHHIFVVTADFSAAPAATPENPRPRPQQIPGSFVILELGQ